MKKGERNALGLVFVLFSAMLYAAPNSPKSSAADSVENFSQNTKSAYKSKDNPKSTKSKNLNQNLQKSRLILHADSVKTEGNVVHASDNVLFFMNENSLQANKISYDRDNECLDMSGAVRIYQNDSLFLDAGSARIDIKNKNATLTPAYLQNTQGIWLSTKKLDKHNEIYDLKKLIVSSCNIKYAVWHIRASSGQYNKDKEYLKLWNTRLYLGAIPFFYFPYVSLPMATKRKSGLLFPEFGYTNNMGAVFIQPLFIAPYDQWDMTLYPQIRTARGYGGYGEFRIADEKNNIARLRVGYFHNYDNYAKNYNLLNKDVKGFEFKYSRSMVFAPLTNGAIQDGAYFDILYMNDIEYQRLKTLHGTYSTRLHTSRANYYASFGESFVGIYGKYFSDMAIRDNKSTMQILPAEQYHHYLSNLFRNKHLFYSVDVMNKNITRPSGYTYSQLSLEAPIGAQFMLVRDYINLHAKLNPYAVNLFLDNVENIILPTNDALNANQNLLNLSYEIGVNSDLAKFYKYVFHDMHFEVLYKDSIYKYLSDGFLASQYKTYSDLAKNLSQAALDTYFNPNDVFDISVFSPLLDLKFSNYLYLRSGRELFYYRVYQRIYTKDSDLTLNQSLRQEIGSSIIDGFNVSANLFYSHRLSAFNEMSINASFNRYNITSSVNYFFKINQEIVNSGIYDLSINKGSTFLRSTLGYDFGYFKLLGNIGYDISNGYMRDWFVSISRDIRCFGVALKFASVTYPLQVSSADKFTTISNQYIKIELRFVPFTRINFTQRLQSN